MITRIELVNFMSHERTVIVPADGLTVLVGPNNCGKSAVVAALQILCNNADSTYVTRHGEKECAVRVDTDDGHRIEWRRKSATSYLINGEKFDRLGRNNAPDQLLKSLRLPRIEIGEDQLVDVHFGEQKSPIFLLDRPASHAAKFFASSSDVDRFLKMQDRHRAKVTEAKAQKQRLEEESKVLNHELELLEPLVELNEFLEGAEKEYHELIALARWLDQLNSDCAELRRQTVMVVPCAARLASLVDLSSPPELESTEALESLLTELGQVGEHLGFISTEVDVIRRLNHPPELVPTDALSALVEEVGRAARELERRHGVSAALTPLAEPPPLEDADSLERLGHDFLATNRLVSRCEEESRLLASLHVPPELGDDDGFAATLGHLIEATRGYAHSCKRSALLIEVSRPVIVEDVNALDGLLSLLRESLAQMVKSRCSKELLSGVEPVPQQDDTTAPADLIDRLKSSAQSVNDVASLIVRLNDDFIQAREELLSWSRDNGICPTCGGPIDAERLVAHLSCNGDAAHD